MRRGFQYAYAVLAWVFLVGVVVQTFYAGMGLFAGAENLEVHVGLGWTLHLVPIVMLIVGAVGRVGRRTMWWTAGLMAAVLVQPFLPAFRDSAPIVAALHPVNALLIFWLALVIALRSLALVRAEAADVPAQPVQPGPA